MAYYILLGYIAVLLTGFAQVLLKKGSRSQHGLLSMYLNFYTLTGYVVMFCVTLLNLYIYRYLDVKYGVIFLPFTFVTVSVLSYLLLKERLGAMQVVGSAIVILGVIVFNL